MPANKFLLPILAVAVGCVSAIDKGSDKKQNKQAAPNPTSYISWPMIWGMVNWAAMARKR